MIAQFLDACNHLVWPGVFAMIGTLIGNWAGDWLWDRFQSC